jgi:translation initiation factor IF-2
MAHRKPSISPGNSRRSATGRPSGQKPRLVRLEAANKLEITLKCDTIGSQEAVLAAIQNIPADPVSIRVIHASVGTIAKSDLDLASTGSHLVIGFNVEAHPTLPRLAQAMGIEVRIYQLIHRLLDELKQLAASLVPPKAEETLTGKAKVISLFKSSRKGIILGCEVQQGLLSVGDRFRLISAMGEVYNGRIGSLHIGSEAVKEGRKGQQVGIKISDFNRVKLGDWVECFKIARSREILPWHPKPGITRIAA